MICAYYSHHFLDLIAICVFVYILLRLAEGRCEYRFFRCLKIKKEIVYKILQQPAPAMSSAPTDGTRPVFFGNGDGGYSVKELLQSSSKFVWKGTFGNSFKTDLKGGDAVVVRRLKSTCSSQIDFRERVQELGILLHENLHPIRAYCLHQNERFLIYDYMRKGSLEKLLHGRRDIMSQTNQLTWEVRCRIAYGVARAIVYLHTTGSTICHGNIKSSNVLLTDSLEPRLSEFGIVRLLSPDNKPILIGGYCAPEVKNAHEVSQEADVYSFGVLLLELLTGISPSGVTKTTAGIDLPKRVRTMFSEKPVRDVFDSELLIQYKDFEDQMVRLLELAVCCTFQYPHRRPMMVSVLKQIRRTCRLEG